jgi:S1-C subfamily serine protease
MKYAHKTVLIILAMMLIFSGKPALAGVTDSLTPCVVFLTQEAGSGKVVNYGTGFIVSRDNRPFLVTASHVARDIGSDFAMIMPGDKDKAVTERKKGVAWIMSPWADVAFTGMSTGNRDEDKKLLQRSIPARLFTARALPPSRDVSLVTLGYPLGLGAKGQQVSPLSFESRAASGLITLDRFDTGKAATFILLQNPSISGLSGGPVFDVGRPLLEGNQLEPRDGLSLVGLVSGVIWDKTGGKIAMIVPATEIARLFDSKAPRT